MVEVTRRRLFGAFGVAVVGTAVGVPLVSGIRGSTSTGTVLPSRLPLPTPFTAAFRVPPVLSPTRSDATTDYYDITPREANVEIIPGFRTPIWGYNGIFPGPTLISQADRHTVVRHHNQLPVPVVVHLHGGHTPPEHDGYPTDLILPAGMGPEQVSHPGDLAVEERDYSYPPQPRAATLWYHDHRMDFTGPAVWRGLAGFHLVHDEHEKELRLPRGDRELPLMLTDRSFAADGSMYYPSLDHDGDHQHEHDNHDDTEMPERQTPGVQEPYGAGVLGDVILVNGVPWPNARVAGARHRLRILNASNARRYRLRLDPAPPGGAALVQIGSDHGLLASPITHEAIEAAPAERYDVIVDFGQYDAGQLVHLVNEFGEDRTELVMRFEVGARVEDNTRIPDQFAPVENLHEADVTTTRTMVFRSEELHGMAGWTINGEPFSPDLISARPTLDTVEAWRLVSDFHHPIHLHLSPFQVLSRGTGGPGPWDHGWKDTVDLRPAEEVTILVRFEEHAGKFVFHCHNLEHEGMMMMGNFQTQLAPGTEVDDADS